MVDGLRPCIPGGTGSTCRSCPRREMYPCGTCYPCPGGEDHLKRRSSSPPVPPLLGYRHCPRRQTEFFSCASAARVQRRGAGGEAPGEINFWAPPSRGEGGGGGGWGQQSKLKAGQGGNPNRQAPLQAPQRQGYPAPRGQAPPPPPGTGLAASARNRKENTPAGNNRRGCS